MGYDWSPDGERLAVADTDPTTGATAIFLVSLDDGTKYRVTDPPEPHLQDSNPDFSPDGRSIAFRRKLGQGRHEVFVVSVDGGDARQLTHTGQDNGGLDWSAAGNVIFSSNHAGTFSLWSVGPDGGELRWLGYEGAVKPSVARSGRGLVYERWRFNLDIWRVAAPGVDARPAEPWLTSSMIDTDPMYSPDGTRLAFVSLRSGSYELWVADATGERPIQLTRFGAPAPAWRPSIHHPRWSRDAKEIVFATQIGPDFDICSVDVASGRIRRLTDGGADHRYPTWGDDDRIYFVSTASADWQLWRMPSEGGDPEQLTGDGAQGPVEIGDDGQVYYRRSWQDGLWRFADGRQEQVLSGPTTPDWAIGPAGIYRIEYDDERRPAIVLHEPVSGDDVWRVPVAAYGPGGFAVSPRDGSILFPRIEANEGDILIARDFDG
jgi:Tol biopolymer transport system component